MCPHTKASNCPHFWILECQKSQQSQGWGPGIRHPSNSRCSREGRDGSEAGRREEGREGGGKSLGRREEGERGRGGGTSHVGCLPS